MVPCVIFEDEHLLVVNKPAGLNTHAPSPYTAEGIYEWLKNREPRWETLAIIHRLDKETSGVLVFSKTPQANRSLTEQFTRRAVRKKYVLVTDHHVSRNEVVVRSSLVRVGERYASRPARQGGEIAETRFSQASGEPPSELFEAGIRPGFRLELSRQPGKSCTLLIAEPRTGRTHQIRAHAAESGFPILGDTLYGGTAAPRVFLHAAEIGFKHPASGEAMSFSAPAQFEIDARQAIRGALLDPQANTCWRIAHGAADGQPGWYVDRLGDYLLAQTQGDLNEGQITVLSALMRANSARGVYHKKLDRQVRRASPQAASPRLVAGDPAPGRFAVRENGLTFELSLEEGYSVGLFLDQRDNRFRLLTGHAGAGFSLPYRQPETAGHPLEVLNTFAYTCAFSVCSAKAGARTTSLDLSRKYLDWGRRNFVLNGLEPGRHDFIFGDVFDWLPRLGKKGRRFGMILLDPPTFSVSKESGPFRVEKDYERLVMAALPLLERNGVLFASTNAAGWSAEDFLQSVHRAVRDAGRNVVQQRFAPQPPDFPVARPEPAYLKTVWLRID